MIYLNTKLKKYFTNSKGEVFYEGDCFQTLQTAYYYRVDEINFDTGKVTYTGFNIRHGNSTEYIINLTELVSLDIYKYIP